MEVIALIIPFIALAIISVMADRLTLVLQAVMNKIPKLPDQFEWYIAYFFVLLISFLVCKEGDFDLFVYFNINFRYEWEGWLLTALVLSGGSSFIRTQFTMIDSIPNVISGVTATIKNIVTPAKKPESSNDNQTSSVTNPTPSQSNSPSSPSSIDYDSDRFTDDI